MPRQYQQSKRFIDDLYDTEESTEATNSFHSVDDICVLPSSIRVPVKRRQTFERDSKASSKKIKKNAVRDYHDGIAKSPVIDLCDDHGDRDDIPKDTSQSRKDDDDDEIKDDEIKDASFHPKDDKASIRSESSATDEPPVPQYNTFLPSLGDHQHWNAMLEQFYRMAESYGPLLDLQAIQENDPELAAWIELQKGKCTAKIVSFVIANLYLTHCIVCRCHSLFSGV